MILQFVFVNELLGDVLDMDLDVLRFFHGHIQVNIIHIKHHKLRVLLRQHVVDRDLDKLKGAHQSGHILGHAQVSPR